MKLSKILPVSVALLLFLFQINSAIADELVTVNPRSDVDLNYMLVPQAKAKAALLLLTGGDGLLALSGDKTAPEINKGTGNFIIRTRDKYAQAGFTIALMDAPSDVDKLSYKYRLKDRHAKEMKVVVDDLRKRTQLPVWIVSTSRSTLSASKLVSMYPDSIDGMILTSSVTKAKKKWPIYDDYPNLILNLPLDKVKFPVMITAHEDDGCFTTPPSNAEALKAKFPNSKNVALKMFSGGNEESSKPCKAQTYHGYLGIEDKVVKSIIDFINANL